MLEESRMDKKSSNRSSIPQSRASAIDCKKSTESSHKPWPPRNNKKREGPGNAPKNEPYRKKGTPSLGGRGQVDRRPQARGGAPNFAMGGAQNTGLEDDDEPEIGSVFVPGSKKQNLNHLLNFMYPSRGPNHGPNHGPDRRNLVPRRPVQRAPFRLDHDLYLRANCQFVVREDGDYKLNLLDPDVPVKWDQVEEIVVRSTGRSECPICLGPPVAGRVGLCGHVYCWACALHYAAAHDKQPPPCPVCSTPLHVKDMRPTKMVQWESPGEEVTMRLVRRPRGSTTVSAAPPRAHAASAPAPSPLLPLGDAPHAPYAKFFTATKQQVRDILDRERKEIQDQIMAEIDTSEVEYLEQALELLKLKEDKLNAQHEQPKPTEVVEEIVPIVYEKQEVNQNKIDWFDMTEDGAPSVETIQDQVEDVAISLAQSNLNPDAPEFDSDNHHEEFPLIDCPEPKPEESKDDDEAFADINKQNQAKYFYFYQADDGQQVFLNSLNVRILNASWGSLAAAPSIIKGRVLHREAFSLGDQMRKHMPYTAHLPLYCSFDIVELDLQPPYVTSTALNNFAEELDRRARTRARQEREERRRERAYRRAMEGPPKPDFSSELLFPAPLSFSPPAEPFIPPLTVEEVTVATNAVAVNAASPPGLSFAKMASTSGTWRVRKTAPLPPPPPDEEAGSAPRALSLSDAIEAALQAAPAPHGKKKKNKQKVLFATGMQRTN